jgi:hypothetical protein
MNFAAPISLAEMNANVPKSRHIQRSTGPADQTLAD